MNKIEAILQPTRVNAVKDALVEIGVEGLTLVPVEGFGRQRGYDSMSWGRTDAARFLTKVKLEVVVNQEMTELVVETIMKTARSGRIGDGRIFVLPVTQAVRIRTGEKECGAAVVLQGNA